MQTVTYSLKYKRREHFNNVGMPHTLYNIKNFDFMVFRLMRLMFICGK